MKKLDLFNGELCNFSKVYTIMSVQKYRTRSNFFSSRLFDKMRRTACLFKRRMNLQYSIDISYMNLNKFNKTRIQLSF